MSKHRFPKCRKLGFDVLEERTLFSVSGLSEVNVNEAQSVAAALAATTVSTSAAAEQSVEILGYDGMLDSTGDSAETGTRYRIFDYWGGAWVDAEKDYQDGDDLLCWAGAASNVLAWTGWGAVGGMTTTDQMFQYFQDHFTDAGSLPQFGWDWWFDGTNPAAGWGSWAQVDVAGGAFYPSYSTYEYIHTRGQGATAQRYSMMDVDQYCRAGYGVALGIFGSIGHAITCWGFNYDSSLSPSDPNYYKGVWVTDSDDNKYTSNGTTAPDRLHYYAVTWDSTSGHYDFNSYSSGAYIGEVDGLERLANTPPPTPLPAAPDDFDSDGISDILWHNQWTGDVGVWLVKNDRAIDWMGLGTMSPSTWEAVGIGDFDGNGISDVLWQNQSIGTVGAWLVNNSGGGFTWQGLGTASASIYKVGGIGDFNADGISDVLWHNQSTGTVGAWIVSSSGGISWLGLGSASAGIYKIAGIGDFNADGISDVLWQNQETGNVGAWLVNSSGAIGWRGLGTASTSIYKIAGIGDFNADGISDVLWQIQETGNVGAWLVNSSGAISWRGLGTASTSIYKVVGIGDFNADGISDVLWHNQQTGNVGAWLVSSSGAISWKGLGTMVPADWKTVCDDTTSSLLASGNAAPECPISPPVQGDRHALLGDAVASAVGAALDASAIAASYQNRFGSDLRSEFGLTDSYVSRVSSDHDPENVSSSASDLGQEVARSAAGAQAGAIDPSVLDRIDLSKWIDDGLHRREDADVFDRLAADRVGGLDDAGFGADWNADVDASLAG